MGMVVGWGFAADKMGQGWGQRHDNDAHHQAWPRAQPSQGRTTRDPGDPSLLLPLGLDGVLGPGEPQEMGQGLERWFCPSPCLSGFSPCSS